MQVREIEATHMAPLDPVEVGPPPLPRIQLGSVGREPFQMEAVSCAVRQKALDHATAVNRRPIPTGDHAAGYLPQQMLQKGTHIFRIDRMLLAGAIQLAFGRDGAAGREMVTSPPRLQASTTVGRNP